MSLSDSIKKYKSNVISKVMVGVKGFNEKHKSLAPITTFFALLFLAFFSVILQLVIGICSIPGGIRRGNKKMIAAVFIALIVIAFLLIRKYAKRDAIVDTIIPEAEVTDEMGASEVSQDRGQVYESETIFFETKDESEEDTEKEIKEVKSKSEGSVNESAITENKAEETIDESATAKSESADNIESDAKADASDTKTSSQIEGASESVTHSLETNVKETLNSNYDYDTKVTSNGWNTLDVDLESFTADYPETVGWIYFEDGHISYPIMQSSDNKKYKTAGYDGNEAWTGAIFLDYRSASDFSDYNSIIYGHNMKDRTMFGSLRDYRENPVYYNSHEYFQVITKDKAYRYLIFAYMDVPESYELYDYVGKASLGFVKDAEPVRIRSYMDSEVPVNENKRVVTLSTCTSKDKLQFVVLGVLVDEEDR